MAIHGVEQYLALGITQKPCRESINLVESDTLWFCCWHPMWAQIVFAQERLMTPLLFNIMALFVKQCEKLEKVLTESTGVCGNPCGKLFNYSHMGVSRQLLFLISMMALWCHWQSQPTHDIIDILQVITTTTTTSLSNIMLYIYRENFVTVNFD